MRFPANYSRISRFIPPILLIGLAVLSYSNADHESIFFDSLHLLEDPVLADLGASWHRFWTSHIRPGQDLSMLSFAANYAWNIRHGRAGFDADSFVAINVFLHAANCACVYFLIRSVCRCA